MVSQAEGEYRAASSQAEAAVRAMSSEAALRWGRESPAPTPEAAALAAKESFALETLQEILGEVVQEQVVTVVSKSLSSIVSDELAAPRAEGARGRSSTPQQWATARSTERSGPWSTSGNNPWRVTVSCEEAPPVLPPKVPPPTNWPAPVPERDAAGDAFAPLNAYIQEQYAAQHAQAAGGSKPQPAQRRPQSATARRVVPSRQANPGRSGRG